MYMRLSNSLSNMCCAQFLPLTRRTEVHLVAQPVGFGNPLSDFVGVNGVSTRPYDPRFPQLCMDEIGKQLVKDKRASLPMRPGDIEKIDYEYEREGVCNVFLACEPLAGKRSAQVTTRRTRADWAEFMREVIDVHYPDMRRLTRRKRSVCGRSWKFMLLPRMAVG